MAENTSNNNENTSGNKNKLSARKVAGRVAGIVLRHPIISLIILAVIVIIILSASDYFNKKKNATEDPNDPKNGPAAANAFINDVYIDDDGVLRTQKSVSELWKELKEKGNALTKYLNSPEELAKLLSASMAVDYPDTRENPDEPIDWSKYDINLDSTEVQGIVKFKRALASGEKITMTYVPQSEFQKKMNEYNRTGRNIDKNEALKYFTIERTVATNTTGTSGGTVDVGSRPFNSDTFNVDSNIDVYSITNSLYGNTYDAVQGCCFDGKYIICSGNKGKHGKHGGSVFWINAETKTKESNRVDIGLEGTHMEGMTYDSARKMVLCVVTGKRLLQIDNQTRNKAGYVNVPNHFEQLAYSVTTQELLGFDRSKKTITFMKYDSSRNEYVEQRKINLNNAKFTNIQGIASDGQVIYLADSKPEMSTSDYRLWVYDFNGNKVEEHKMGNGFVRGTEVENCYVDKEGNLWLTMPHEVVKVKDYKAHPVDWENNSSIVSSSAGNPSSTGSTTSTTTDTSTIDTSTSQNTASTSKASGFDIVKEAEKYVGKLPYVWGGESLQTGADCSGFAWAILTRLKLINWGRTSDVGFRNKGKGVQDISGAQPGDILCFNGHIAIYKGKVNGEDYMIEALNEQYGITNTRKVSDEKRPILTIRRFTDNMSSSSLSTTATLGPVETDELFGQFSEDTRKIILEHRNDFNKNNYREFINNFPGGYDGYIQSLGGVFAKYGGKGRDVKATDAGTFQEIAEYTWGLFAIWGFDYWNGSTYVPWGKSNSEVAQSAYYPSHRREGGYSTGHIDDICSNPNKNMRTNCNYGSNSFLTKAGLTNDNNFTTHYKRGQKVEKLEDFQIGDLVHFFGSDGRWHHVAVVGEIDPNLGPILYDSGNRFIRSGNYKFPLSSNKYSNYAYWLGRRYFDIDQSTSGQIGTGVASESGTKYVYKVKVATWEENTEIVESTDASENINERNYSMNPITIPYQDIVAQYRMPFNYLWTMLLISQDKKYTFDLADLVRNSQIEITIHDNYNETKTVTKEEKTTDYKYTGQANVKYNYSYKDISGTIIQGSNTIGPINETATDKEYYEKTTTYVNKTNTLDIGLTLADAWCVKYEKEYIYNEKPNKHSTNTQTDKIQDSDEDSAITNSKLKNNILGRGKSIGSQWVNSQGTEGSVSSTSIVHNDNEYQKVEITTNTKTTVNEDTKSSSYIAKPEKFTEETPERERFVEVFKKHYKGRSNILSTKDWLFEILESNKDTVNMVDLTKYLMYKATGINYGVTTYNFKVYNPADFTGIGGGTLQGNSTEEKVWLALINAGFNDVAAAGAMGNLSYESGGSGTKTINTDVVEGGYTENDGGIGMCQWTNNNRGTEGRNTQLRKYAQSKGKTWKDETTQIEFLITEITGQGNAKGYASYQFMTKTYVGVTYTSDSVKNVENDQSKIDYATKAFAATFERPAESAFIASIQKRVELANYFYSQFKGKRAADISGATGSFNLEHAINVSSEPHKKEHENLTWHGSTVGKHAGMIGAYVEAINILNGKDYTLLEIYNKILSAHPEQKTKNKPVYENYDINDYYNISVSRASANINEVKKALEQGKLVADIANTTKWRNEKGNLWGKTGQHTGLIFYFDGTYYHMKTSVKKNAIYTEAQLIEWLRDTKDRLIIYSRK